MKQDTTTGTLEVSFISTILSDSTKHNLNDSVFFCGSKYLLSCKDNVICIFGASQETEIAYPEDTPFTIHQIISDSFHSSMIEAVAWCKDIRTNQTYNGIFAVASKGVVLIYAPQTLQMTQPSFHSIKVCWLLVSLIPH